MHRPRKGRTPSTVVTVLALPVAALALASSTRADPASCNDTGITLPHGFCATIFADHVGHARHMAVGANGVVYVNTWSGRYYKNAKPPEGGFLLALKDSKGEGRADVVMRFGATPQSGGSGGTGIALFEGALYAEEGGRILRYALAPDAIAPTEKPEVVLSGLPLTGDHPMHPFMIDTEGNLYIDLASATDSCQVENRIPESPGAQPCRELETRGGVWRYDAKRTGQRFSPAERFATGIRNAEGLAFDATGLYATQHGRDQLAQNWPKLYTPQEGANLPAEELVKLQRGADYGWPECYYDGSEEKLVLSPEYGGDGGKAVGVCADKQGPIAAFPAHWAPNALLLYHGKHFPSAYDGGFFIAFHGSWNRAPFPQGGYNVVFQPAADGKPSGKFVVFADGFAGATKEPGGAAHRPSGLAQGPDGALYVSDDVGGRIWRITFQGDVAATGIEAAPPATAATGAGAAEPPEGVHREAGRAEAGALPVPPGATAAQVSLGAQIFQGQAAGGACAGCHGSNGKGTAMGPDLTRGKWLWGDGSLASIRETIAKGVPQPKEYADPMPPRGGAPLSDADVDAVAAYVWALGHPGSHSAPRD